MKILPLEHIRDDLEAARVWVLLHMFYLDLDNAKTENSVGQVSIPQAAVELLIQEHEKHPDRMVNLYK